MISRFTWPNFRDGDDKEGTKVSRVSSIQSDVGSVVGSVPVFPKDRIWIRI